MTDTNAQITNTQFQIIDLATRRIAPTTIAARLGVKIDKVYSCIRRARSDGANIPYFRTRNNPPPERAPASPHIVIPLRLHSLLLAEAERRERTPNETAQLLLERALLEGWSRHGC